MHRDQFPIFQKYPGLAYLDNAATTQKPEAVIESVRKFYREQNANVHRGLYPLSEAATDLYEESRASVAGFINAAAQEIIFTGGTTDSLNALAQTLHSIFPDKTKIKVLLTELEHHANIVPWQLFPERYELSYISVKPDYTLNLDEINNTAEFDVVSVTHISNVTGTVNDLRAIRDKFPKTILIVDAAQSFAHQPIDVKELGVDFLAASAHKAYGPTGIGILYGKAEYLNKLPPFRAGGGMIMEVGREKSTFAEIPQKFEAGTPNMAGAAGLGAAIRFISDLGWQEMQAHESRLRRYAIDELSKIDGLQLHHPSQGSEHAGVLSFSLGDVHAHDLSQILGELGVAVRAGHHCTHILHREVLHVPATTRASLAIYNTEEEIDRLVAGIKTARERLR